MSKYLIALLILLKSSYAAKSQTTDTLCFPVSVIQKVLIAANQKKAQDTLIALYQSDIGLLQGKISLMEEKDRNHLQIQSAYQGQVNTLEREVKKWKRKTRWTAIGGVLLTGMVTTLFIIK